jgi:hypothetical protein
MVRTSMVLTKYGPYVDGPYGVWFVRRWSLRSMVRTSMVLTAYAYYVEWSLQRLLITSMVLTENGPYVGLTKKGQTMIYKTLHRKLKIDQNEIH